jgi:hypothetical protein
MIQKKRPAADADEDAEHEGTARCPRARIGARSA